MATCPAVRLETFLRKRRWTYEMLAEELRVNRSTIHRLLTGKKTQRNASLALAIGIERATGGVVRAEDVPLSKRSRAALREMRQARSAA